MHFVPEYSTKDNKTINHFNSNESLHHVPEPEYIGKDNKTMHHFNSNEAMHYVPDYSTKDNKTIHPYKNNEARTSSPTHSTGSSTHSTESTGYTNHSLVNRSFHSERAEEDGDALRRSLHRDRGLGYAGESLSIATARNKIENQVEVNDYVSERDKYANHSLTNRSFHSERAEEDGDALRRSLHRDRGLGYTGESPSIATARNKIENQVKLNDYVNERDSPRGKSKSTKKVKKVKKPDKQYDRISLPVKLNPQNASYEPYEKPAPYRPHRDKETDSSRPAKPKKEKERSKKDRSKKDESKKEKAKKTRKEKKSKQENVEDEILRKMHGNNESKAKSKTLLRKFFDNINTKKGKHPPRTAENLFQKPLIVPDDYVPPVYPKTKKEDKLIEDAVKDKFTFQNLPPATINTLKDAFERTHYAAESKITKQGEVDDYFYVVGKGECEVEVDGVKVGTVKTGETFGEESLMYSTKRMASLITKMDTDLFRVGQSTFRSLVESEVRNRNKRKLKLLRKVDVLRCASDEQLLKLIPLMEQVNFEKDDVIVDKESFGESFYILIKGEAECRGQLREENRNIGRGECWGTNALAGQSTRAKTDVVALKRGSAYVIDRSSIENALGIAREVAMACQPILHTVDALTCRKVRVLSEKMINDLVKAIQVEQYAAGDVIMQANTVSEAALYFLKRGNVHAVKGRSFLQISQGTFFGQDLFESAKEAKKTVGVSSCEAKAVRNVTCGVLYIRDWYKVLGLKFEDSMIMDDVEEEEEVTEICLDRIEKHACLGEGQFGQVWLCSNKDDEAPEPYVLKIMSKYHLISEEDAEVCIQEKKALVDLKSHPFIINLVTTHQDDAFLFMLLDFVQGGELFSVMNPIEGGKLRIKENQAKFYALGIADALAFMHKKKYVYRDLKPENILIDAMGYPIIIDFGFAKFVEEYTYTLCGTPGYLAPEAILGQGHNAAIDHWALGILVYEMVMGRSPFFEDGVEQFKLFRKITEDKYPRLKQVSLEVSDLISRLLVKNPCYRLGSLAGGDKDILGHQWFDGWGPADFRARQLDAPWKPVVNDPFDTSNFDDWSELEDTMLEPGPTLDEEEQAKFIDF